MGLNFRSQVAKKLPENYILCWSEIGPGFGEASCTLPPKSLSKGGFVCCFFHLQGVIYNYRYFERHYQPIITLALWKKNHIVPQSFLVLLYMYFCMHVHAKCILDLGILVH